MAIGFAFLALIAVSGALLAAGWLGLTGNLPRNHFAGIRVGYSMKSDEHWRIVHRAAGPYIVLAAAGVLSASLAFMPFAFAGKIPEGLAVVMLLGQAAFIIFAVLIATTTGLRKAHRILD